MAIPFEKFGRAVDTVKSNEGANFAKDYKKVYTEVSNLSRGNDSFRPILTRLEDASNAVINATSLDERRERLAIFEKQLDVVKTSLKMQRDFSETFFWESKEDKGEKVLNKYSPGELVTILKKFSGSLEVTERQKLRVAQIDQLMTVAKSVLDDIVNSRTISEWHKQAWTEWEDEGTKARIENVKNIVKLLGEAAAKVKNDPDMTVAEALDPSVEKFFLDIGFKPSEGHIHFFSKNDKVKEVKNRDDLFLQGADALKFLVESGDTRGAARLVEAKFLGSEFNRIRSDVKDNPKKYPALHKKITRLKALAIKIVLRSISMYGEEKWKEKYPDAKARKAVQDAHIERIFDDFLNHEIVAFMGDDFKLRSAGEKRIMKQYREIVGKNKHDLSSLENWEFIKHEAAVNLPLMAASFGSAGVVRALGRRAVAGWAANAARVASWGFEIEEAGRRRILPVTNLAKGVYFGAHAGAGLLEGTAFAASYEGFQGKNLFEGGFKKMPVWAEKILLSSLVLGGLHFSKGVAEGVCGWLNKNLALFPEKSVREAISNLIVSGNIEAAAFMGINVTAHNLANGHNPNVARAILQAYIAVGAIKVVRGMIVIGGKVLKPGELGETVLDGNKLIQSSNKKIPKVEAAEVQALTGELSSALNYFRSNAGQLNKAVKLSLAALSLKAALVYHQAASSAPGRAVSVLVEAADFKTGGKFEKIGKGLFKLKAGKNSSEALIIKVGGQKGAEVKELPATKTDGLFTKSSKGDQGALNQAMEKAGVDSQLRTDIGKSYENLPDFLKPFVRIVAVPENGSYNPYVVVDQRGLNSILGRSLNGNPYDTLGALRESGLSAPQSQEEMLAVLSNAEVPLKPMKAGMDAIGMLALLGLTLGGLGGAAGGIFIDSLLIGLSKPLGLLALRKVGLDTLKKMIGKGKDTEGREVPLSRLPSLPDILEDVKDVEDGDIALQDLDEADVLREFYDTARQIVSRVRVSKTSEAIRLFKNIVSLRYIELRLEQAQQRGKTPEDMRSLLRSQERIRGEIDSEGISVVRAVPKEKIGAIEGRFRAELVRRGMSTEEIAVIEGAFREMIETIRKVPGENNLRSHREARFLHQLLGPEYAKMQRLRNQNSIQGKEAESFCRFYEQLGERIQSLESRVGAVEKALAKVESSLPKNPILRKVAIAGLAAGSGVGTLILVPVLTAALGAVAGGAFGGIAGIILALLDKIFFGGGSSGGGSVGTF